MATNITSPVIKCANLDNVAIQLDWTGTPTGVFAVQTSVDHAEDNLGNPSVVGTWINIPLSAAITASGAPDDAHISLNQLPGSYIRVVYTATSGAGTLSMYVAGKGI